MKKHILKAVLEVIRMKRLSLVDLATLLLFPCHLPDSQFIKNGFPSVDYAGLREIVGTAINHIVVLFRS